MASAWLARRWYYTPRSHRAYSVRQISPGDRRLLAEFALGLSRAAPEREAAALRDLTSMLFDRVIATGAARCGGIRGAREHRGRRSRDRRRGLRARATTAPSSASPSPNSYRDEQVGRTLLATLVRHARRVGVPRLTGEMFWSNRPMQMLAMSMGFAVEPVPRDRNLRRLVLALK